VIERATLVSGARTARIIRPGQAYTQEFNPDRLNIEVDARQPHRPAQLRVTAPAAPRSRPEFASSRLLARRLGATLLAFVLGAASPAVNAADLAFSPEQFFAGESYSSGVIRTLVVSRERFTARFAGEAAEGRLRLDERFAFADGKRLQRWDLQHVGGGAYQGTVQTETGDGVLREPRPVAGRLTAGGAVLEYEGYAPGGGETRFNFRHRMTAQPDGTVLNRVSISKLGLPVATARVTFAKSPSQLPGR
jgi:hypothetical protein